MKTMIALIRKDLLQHFGTFVNIRASLRDKKSRQRLFGYAVGAILIIVYSFYFIKIMTLSYAELPTVALQRGFLFSAFMVHQFMLLIFSILTIIGTYYFNDDVKIMLRLPIETRQIFKSKLFTLTLENMFWWLALTVPMVIHFGRVTGQGIVFYISAALGSIAITVITLSVLTLITVLIMSLIVKLPGAKNIVQYFSIFVGLAIGISIQLYVQKGQRMDGDESVLKLVDALTKPGEFWFPHAKKLTDGLLAGGGEMILTVVLLVILAYGMIQITARLGSSIFLRSSLQEGSRKKHKKRIIGEKDYQKNKPYISIAKKELREIFKTPIYLYQYIAMGMLLPILILMPSLSKGIRMDQIHFMREEFMLIYETADVQAKLFILFGAIFIGWAWGLFIGVQQPSFTSITREGKRIWLLQSLPVAAKDQVRGRVLTSLVLQLITALPLFLVILFMLMPPWTLLIGFLFGMSTSIYLMVHLALWMDIRNPKLLWYQPKEAINKGGKSFFYVFGIMIFVGVQIYAFVKPALALGLMEKGIFIQIAFALWMVLYWVFSYVMQNICADTLEKKITEYSAE
ncbi:MAG: hypothetical protein Q4Q17_00235 [Tissierellia bacterium]|nr:hypothetical protein [Tissierellia bacterium]